MELSIVIVIIGLIVAGVVAGQSLVKQAQLRAAISDINKYRLAYNTFKLEYNSIPGDMKNASDYWGVGTNNGNGNKVITCSDTSPSELGLAWQHMQLAKLIDGAYSGFWPTGGTCNSGNDITVGLDTPKGPIRNSIYVFYKHQRIYNKIRNNQILFSAYTTQNTNWLDGLLAAKDAYSLDTKIDDGIANTGKAFSMRGRFSYDIANECIADNGATTPDTVGYTGADYYLPNTAPNCVMLFDTE